MKSVIVCVIFLIYSASLGKGDEQMNIIVDTALEMANEQLHEKGLDVIKLPELNNAVSYEFMGFTLSAALNAKTGSVGNVSTLVRKGDTIVTQNDKGDNTFLIGFGLDDLKLTYETLIGNYLFISFGDSMTATCGEIGLRVNLTIGNNEKGDCFSIIHSLEVSQLENLDVTFTPSRFGNWIFNKILSIAISLLPIKHFIESAALPLLQQAPICDVMPM